MEIEPMPDRLKNLQAYARRRNVSIRKPPRGEDGFVMVWPGGATRKCEDLDEVRDELRSRPIEI
jgi:hypothetical protein